MGKRGRKSPGWATVEILGALGENCTTKEISVLLEVPLSSVQRWVKKLNVVTKSRKVEKEI